MGGYNATSDNIVQEINGQLQGGIWGMPAYWNGNVYFWGRNDNLRAFSVTAGKLSAQRHVRRSGRKHVLDARLRPFLPMAPPTASCGRFETDTF